MAFSKPICVAFLFLLVAAAGGCGYLDEELWVDDETFDEGITMEGIGIHGSGVGWGCGGAIGIGIGRRYHRTRHSRVHTGIHHGDFHAEAGSAAGPTDREILESTDIEMIDETPTMGTVEAVYYESKAERDASIARHYAPHGG